METNLENQKHNSIPQRVSKVFAALGWQLTLSGVLAVAAEAVSLASEDANSILTFGLSAVSILVGGRTTLLKGLKSLWQLKLNIDALMAIAVVGAFAVGEWPEAAMVIFLFAISEMIEEYAVDRSRRAIQSLIEITPTIAMAEVEPGQWREIEATTVVAGQMVRVRPGERIPLDGMVKSGSSFVNQAPITGESMPVEKKAGDLVFAGTINDVGTFEFQAKSNQSDSTLARIIRAVEQAQSQKAPTERFVDQFAKYYTPTVVVLAILIAVVPPLSFSDLGYSAWLYRGLVLLVIGCPCALVISVPVTLVSGLAAAARNGLLVKGGAFLEAGRSLRMIALDKTGTLTVGRSGVTDIVPLGNRNNDEVLTIAGRLDEHSEHPVARAIVTRWNELRSKHGNGNTPTVTSTSSGTMDGFEAIPGKGAKARVDGVSYFIGNRKMADDLLGPASDRAAILDRFESEGKTAVVLGSQNEAIALFGVADTLRPESSEAVAELNRLGISTVMLTGDNPTTARKIAEMVGISDVQAGLLPEQKLDAISSLVGEHKSVGMVGDGVNDAPALAKASIGFAMGAAGSGTALETADVALLGDDLRGIPRFIQLSKATHRILIQNISFAIGIKLVCFVLALAGIASLWLAVLADAGAALVVSANGLRVLRTRLR